MTKKKEQELLENYGCEQREYIPWCIYEQLSDYIDKGLLTVRQLNQESNTRQILEKVKRTRSQLEIGLQALTHLSGNSSDNLKESIKITQDTTKQVFHRNTMHLPRRYSDPAEKQEFQLRSNSWEKLSANPIGFKKCLEKVDFLGHRNKVNLNLFTDMKTEYSFLFP